MAEITIAGIMRAGTYSPNHIGNDAAIINAVADNLRKRGCIVNLYSEEQFNEKDITETVIINMSRQPNSIARLQRFEDEGRIVINSGYGVENCSRERMTRLFMACDIPIPQSLIFNTDEAIKAKLKQHGIHNCWVKRGEDHTMHKEDVTYVRHPEEAQEVLQELFLRGIKRAVITEHLTGDLLKFYGIRNYPYFFWFYPFDNGHSKYGDETINGKPYRNHFDENEFKQICNKAAEELNVMVYGGDAIISPDGKLQIIDFNDWPSFAPCRAQAAQNIAKAIIAEIKKRNANL